MEWLAFASSESYFLLKLSTKCSVFWIYHSILRHIVYSCLATLATPSGKRRSSTSNSLERLTQRKNKRILFEAIWLGVRLFHRCLFSFYLHFAVVLLISVGFHYNAIDYVPWTSYLYSVDIAWIVTQHAKQIKLLISHGLILLRLSRSEPMSFPFYKDNRIYIWTFLLCCLLRKIYFLCCNI